MSETRKPIEWTDEDLQNLLADARRSDPPLDDSGPHWHEPKARDFWRFYLALALVFAGFVYLAWG